eukprot:31253-Eustigmatos_ZCMA.PRE.1
MERVCTSVDRPGCTRVFLPHQRFTYTSNTSSGHSSPSCRTTCTCPSSRSPRVAAHTDADEE